MTKKIEYGKLGMVKNRTYDKKCPTRCRIASKESEKGNWVGIPSDPVTVNRERYSAVLDILSGGKTETPLRMREKAE